MAIEYAPLHRDNVSMIARSNVGSFDRAIKCTIASVSDIELKIAPSASSCSRSSGPLTRLPLCASATGPLCVIATIGCALQIIDPPAVE